LSSYRSVDIDIWGNPQNPVFLAINRYVLRISRAASSMAGTPKHIKASQGTVTKFTKLEIFVI
jgi:hypothetical protein